MLEARVRQLQDECQAALDQTSAALATGDGPSDTPGEAVNPDEIAA